VEGINNLIGMAVLFGGVALILGQLWGLSFGALAAFVGVMQSTYGPLRDLTRGWTKLQEAVPSAERFFEILDERPETPDPPNAVQVDGLRHGIRFAKVLLLRPRAGAARRLARRSAGEVVALIGRTGSGKTTLADLLLRFYEPSAGSIEIDGVDLRRLARGALLEHVAVVSQEPFLFGGTIRDNIATAPGRQRRRAPRCARRLCGRFVASPPGLTRPSATPAQALQWAPAVISVPAAQEPVAADLRRGPSTPTRKRTARAARHRCAAARPHRHRHCAPPLDDPPRRQDRRPRRRRRLAARHPRRADGEAGPVSRTGADPERHIVSGPALPFPARPRSSDGADAS
jgi:hypothetical protein